MILLTINRKCAFLKISRYEYAADQAKHYKEMEALSISEKSCYDGKSGNRFNTGVHHLYCGMGVMRLLLQPYWVSVYHHNIFDLTILVHWEWCIDSDLWILTPWPKSNQMICVALRYYSKFEALSQTNRPAFSRLFSKLFNPPLSLRKTEIMRLNVEVIFQKWGKGYCSLVHYNCLLKKIIHCVQASTVLCV